MRKRRRSSVPPRSNEPRVHHQRSECRPRTLTTTSGDLDLQIPKVPQATLFPAPLVRPRLIDLGVLAPAMEAYRYGLSARKVDHIVNALGAETGNCKSDVSRGGVGFVGQDLP